MTTPHTHAALDADTRRFLKGTGVRVVVVEVVVLLAVWVFQTWFGR